MLQVSLVIPVRDESKTIEALLNSINAQTYQPAEIVFVDGGSVDGTLDKLRDLARQNERIRIIEAGEATPGRGRNVGITSARCEWVALTDAGIRLEPGWLEQLVKVVEQNSAIEVVYGNYEPVTDSRFERCAALAYPPPKQYRAGSRMRGPSIASVLMKREVWRAVGGLPDLRAAEDLIFMKRIEDQGFSIGWAPDATVWWQLQPTLARTFRKFVLYSRHNVWAGMQRFWHYGIARQYLVWSFFLVLAFVHSIWWLVVPGAGILARVAKSIWIRREGRGLFWAMNPGQFVGVMVILLTIDLATFIGWWQARWRPQPGTSCKQAINLLFIFLLAP